MLSNSKDAAYPSAYTGQMEGDWHTGNIPNSGYGASVTNDISSAPFALPLGLNRKASLYLKMAYAVKGYNCYAGGIYRDSPRLRGKDSIPLGEIVIFDIFPETLDKFYAMDWDGASSHIQCNRIYLTGGDYDNDCRYGGQGLRFRALCARRE